MRINIKGATWQKHVLLHAAVVYFAKKLEIFYRRISLGLVLIPRMESKKGCRGEAHQDSKRVFRIRLDSSLKPISLIKCLAHEMVHIEQYMSGKMEDIFQARFSVRWGKRIYYPTTLAYEKHPWEIQAHKLEEPLFKSFTGAWGKGEA